MTDPYKILGVSPSASDDEVKAVYRELARRYHPDNFQDEAEKRNAEQKMSEINAAYDAVMDLRRGGGQNPRSQFIDIRNLINQKRISEAEELLDGVPEYLRDAEWNFLKGSVLYSKGWLDQALSYFSKATTADPQNAEYRAAYERLSRGRTAPYSNPGSAFGGSGCSGCDICSGLLCADCCCECMGGDLIRCC